MAGDGCGVPIRPRISFFKAFEYQLFRSNSWACVVEHTRLAVNIRDDRNAIGSWDGYLNMKYRSMRN